MQHHRVFVKLELGEEKEDLEMWLGEGALCKFRPVSTRSVTRRSPACSGGSLGLSPTTAGGAPGGSSLKVAQFLFGKSLSVFG